MSWGEDKPDGFFNNCHLTDESVWVYEMGEATEVTTEVPVTTLVVTKTTSNTIETIGVVSETSEGNTPKNAGKGGGILTQTSTKYIGDGSTETDRPSDDQHADSNASRPLRPALSVSVVALISLVCSVYECNTA